MRLRALFVVPALLVAGVGFPAAAATTVPSVGFVDVAGLGPGDLVRVTGYQFSPGVATTATMSDGTNSFPLAMTTAASDGTVSLPPGIRIPLAVPPSGRQGYAVTFAQTGGVSAVSPGFEIRNPEVDFFSFVPGRPVDLVHSDPTLFLYGLANTADVVRSVTVDGRAAAIDWYSDDRAFANAGVSVALPANLALGEHQLTFTQTGPTPFTSSGTFLVTAPAMTLPASTGIRAPLALNLTGTAYSDDFDVTVVGAAGDRHTASVWSVRHRADGSLATTAAVQPAGTLSVGTATVTAKSRTNGGTARGTVVVDPAFAEAPVGLAPGARITSPDGKVTLVMQTDGNLVENGYPVSRTSGHPGAWLTVQTDGNLVVRAPNGAALWNTGTAGGGNGARLTFDNSDAPVLVMANGRVAWSTFFPGHRRVVAGSLHAGEYLFQGQILSNSASAEVPYSVNLTLQTDGNLVLVAYSSGVVWTSRTAGHPGAYLVLQTDGNLVLRAANGSAIWANGVHGVSGARLTPQYNGDLGEFAPDGRVLWHLGTRGIFPSS